MPVSTHKIALLALMAMGNWVNVPSPPLDPDAPGPAGNEGELVLDGTSYRVQSAQLSGGMLTLRGETSNGAPQFVLCAALPGDIAEGESLRQATFPIKSGTLGDGGEPAKVTGGRIAVTSATGSGPWEIDGEVDLTTSDGESYSGTLEARIQASD